MWLFLYVKHIIKSRGFIEVFGSDMVSYIKHVLFVTLLFKATSVMPSFENDVLLDTNINFLYMKYDLESYVSVQCDCCFIADRSNISVLLALQKAESGLVMSNSTYKFILTFILGFACCMLKAFCFSYLKKFWSKQFQKKC